MTAVAKDTKIVEQQGRGGDLAPKFLLTILHFEFLHSNPIRVRYLGQHRIVASSLNCAQTVLLAFMYYSVVYNDNSNPRSRGRQAVLFASIGLTCCKSRNCVFPLCQIRNFIWTNIAYYITMILSWHANPARMAVSAIGGNFRVCERSRSPWGVDWHGLLGRRGQRCLGLTVVCGRRTDGCEAPDPYGPALGKRRVVCGGFASQDEASRRGAMRHRSIVIGGADDPGHAIERTPQIE